MASILNSRKDIDVSLVGKWENIQDYTTAILTFSSPVDGSGVVEWAHTDGRTMPTDNDIIASERFEYDASDNAVTKQFDHRARWFRVRYDHDPLTTDLSFSDMSFNIQTLYKKAPTELKIVDDSANIVSVNAGEHGNSLYTVLTDAQGELIRTTNPEQTTGEALFTHLADSSGNSLATTVTGMDHESLFVSLRDASNVAFDSTGELANTNALYVRPGDASGNAQASTYKVKDAHVEGVALYGALADNCGYQITTTETAGDAVDGHNSLYVHLTDKDGASITQDNPLPVLNIAESVGAYPFDVSYGIEENFVSPFVDASSIAVDKKVNLYNIFVFNESPTTVWLKIYDVSIGALEEKSLDTDLYGLDITTSLSELGPSVQKYNLTVQPGRARDISLPGGATFFNGVHVRATTQYKADSVQGPGPDMVFLNGTYTLEDRDVTP
jgi:hypothetical protein